MAKTAEKADKAAEKEPDQATERAPERTTDETIVSGQGFTGAVPDVPAPGEEVLTYPNWGPPEPDPDQVISLHELLLAEFYGEAAEPVSWAHVARFEQFCRDHNIGGTNRNSEGFYGEKTRDLVRTAYRDLLGRENPEGRFDWDLLNVLRGMGAPVEG
jgi:hypothetical protein